MTCSRSLKALLYLLLACLAPSAAAARPTPVPTLRHMPATGLVLDQGWTYRPGDDPRWALPATATAADARQWQPINPGLSPRRLPQVPRAGIGWLRLRFRVAPALRGQALTLGIFQYAASEVYFNGRLLRRYGTLGPNPRQVLPYWPDGQPIELRLGEGAEQVLAIRLAQWPPFFVFSDFFVPFLLQARLDGVPQLMQNFQHEATYKTADMLLFGAFLLLSMLHLAFYLYNTAQRANLYFAFYTLAQACSFCCTGFLDEVRRMDVRLAVDILSYVALQTGGILAVRALYSLFGVRRGLIYYGLWAANGISLLLLTFSNRLSWYPTVGFMVLVTAEQLRLTLGALRQTKRAAGIIAAGFGLALLLLLTFGYLARFQPQVLGRELLSIPVHTLLTFPAFLSPVLAISLFLARRFAIDSRLLTIKLAQVRRLSAQTSAQQQEKQELLARQNETLEQLVQQRTAALQLSLTNLQNAQHQLIQAEKMASLGELTAGIAHEIQNPLNFVTNFADVAMELLKELKEGPLLALAGQEKQGATALVEELTEDLDRITYHGRRADGIVKGMLQHSRAGRGERQPTDLNALADEFLRLAYHGLRAKHPDFNATLTTRFDQGLGRITVSAQELGRVLLNLFNNAFYAVQQRQKLAQPGYRPEVCVTTQRQPDGRVAIRVRDNGLGIPAAVRQKIFQPFFTTKPPGEGTGLGLSLSYDIVTKGHGGTLTVATQEGDYTEFTVSLPTENEQFQALTFSV
ncbi:His Kinase A (phospho-acceptor) domain-containing protein [Hymenobacter daecheongensis DSM 21074]|uniref:histidine kinase n=1 Tax=Hymenobacter daecheongensis DSM 21074 TaxID=1121955 RepID=A0A1M6ANI4_9BACT|nr:ATP-binding protein [Hymenobacter daecheongensis]SHI37898.1 His Kinase A (phospho-acceptor) domain-containing protein [Hymenobacter daecheongensis DSM 21074]